jgi:hypothetical protein
MSTLIFLIFLTIGVSITNGNYCACCFPNEPHTCQTPGINLPSCDDCTSSFCANHVKGCQGVPQCTAECQSTSSTTTTASRSSSSVEPITSTITTPSKSSSSVKPITSTPSSGEITVQIEVILITLGLILLVFV